ncbi:hypothetical protein RRG08_016115 [Elysia crispata]|uniref:Uncharacterized protein n=1 Tax=Elysia crispata TaxID=231223 RepID=A0AAE0ZNH9_9GAST|nr:hypothetical protein RRG08_016115 [Elysia crispata]
MIWRLLSYNDIIRNSGWFARQRGRKTQKTKSNWIKQGAPDGRDHHAGKAYTMVSNIRTNSWFTGSGSVASH